jgi:glucose/mannose-6-phosphate isomerase
MSEDALQAIRAVDSANQLAHVLAMPEHLRDALWRAESARIKPFGSSGLIVCGMGGSGIGGVLARAALGDRLRLPLLAFRDYVLPPWTAPDRAILCMSYSGETEETLACFEAAEAIGARRFVATTGGTLAEVARRAGVPVIGMPAGFQPRSAVGYMFAIVCEVAALAGATEPVRSEIDSAASHLEAAADELKVGSAEVAAELEGTVPVIYGCDLTVPVAYRWKTQINENAKQHAFWHQIPELDHNEIGGWGSEDGSPRFAAVLLSDRDQHPRERQRAELTGELIAESGAPVVRVETEGETRIERLLWTVMLGDLVSLHLAAQRGVDPSPVEAIDRFKRELGSP